MSSTAEKTHHPTPLIQQKAKGSTFFRKEGVDTFFGQSETKAFFSSVQAQLEVSHPDDPHEKEADSVAAEVSRMAEPVEKEKKEEVHRAVDEKEKEKDKVHTKSFGVISRQGNSGGFPDHAAADEEGAPVEVHAKISPSLQRHYLMRKAPGPARGPPEEETGNESVSFQQSLSSSKGEGSPLPEDTRRSMEGRFGADFSGVRIHTGTAAETLSRSINAQAFTYGNDIYFNTGKFSPDTAGGSVLLAHELTHTIQQGASPAKTGATGSVAAKSIQRKSINRTLQRQEGGAQRNAGVELAKAEVGKVSAKKTGPDGHRMGWERLLEYFKTTFGADKILPEGASVQPGTVSEGDIKTYREFEGAVMINDGLTQGRGKRDAMPSWCGIFAFWALNKGGIPLKKWTLGTSMIPPEAAYPAGYQPQPGDLAYRKEYSHYALVASSDGSNVTSVNGNTAGDDNVGGEIQVQTHPMEHWAGFFNPILIMEGSLRDPGSPDVAGAAPAKSLKELRKELFKVQTKGETETAGPTVSTAATTAATTTTTATSPGAPAATAASAPTTTAVAEKSRQEKTEDKEQEEASPVSPQFDISRSMDGGKYHETQRAVSDPDEEPSTLATAATQNEEASEKSVTGEVQLQPINFPNRGPPSRAPPVIQAVVHRKLIQRSWLGDAWDAVSGFVGEAAEWVAKGLNAAKTWLIQKVRDFVSKIPGYRMLCLILGHDPITTTPTPLTGATLLDAGLDLLPLGFMFRELMTRLGIFNDVAKWLQGRINDLNTLVSGIGARFDRFWDGLSLDSIKDPQKVMNDVAEIFRSAVEGIVNFITNAASEFLEMVKRVMIREVSAFVRTQIPHLFPLLTVALGFNPETMEPVARNGTNILNAFLEVSEAGREQRTQMQETGTFQKIVGWIDRGIAVFGRAWTLLKAAFSGIWNHVNVESLFHPIQTFTDIWNSFAEPVGMVGQFLLDAAIEILKVIKDVLLRRLSAYARQTRGYGLVCVLIGRDPFTGEVVERTVDNIVKGFFSLLDGGEAQYEELKKSGAIDRIIAKVEAAVAELNMTPQAIIQLFIDLWNSFSIHDLVHPIDCFMRIVNKFGEPILRLIKFVIKIIMIVVEAILILMNFPFDLIGQIIEKAKQAYELIKKDPAGFFKNLLAAIKQGFIQFFDNILTHLLNGLKQWFLGEVQDAGIPIPTDFTVLGIIKWLLAVLDITMEKIWKKLEERIGKEKVDKIKKIVAMAERAVGIATEAIQFVEDVKQRGLVTVIGEKIMEQLSNAWDLVLDALKSWVMDQIIKKVTAKLLSMLDPTGIMAVVNSCIALYKAIQSFIKYLRRMLEIVNSFVEGVLEIAQGAIGNAANFLEGALARGIPVAIGFLANQVGLNLSERLKEALEMVREKVDKGLTWVIDKLATVFEKLVALGKSAVSAVKGWLGLKKEFTLSNGETHEISFSGTEESPQVMVASTKKVSIETLVSDRRTKTPAPTPAQNTALTNALQKKTDMDTFIATNQKANAAGGSDTSALQSGIETRLDAIKQDLIAGDAIPVTPALPLSNVTYSMAGGKAQTVIAKPLTKLPGNTHGSPPAQVDSIPLGWTHVRAIEGAHIKMWVKAHLLNDNLHGPGETWNLVPATQQLNAAMRSGSEKWAKDEVAKDDIIHYKTVVTGWHNLSSNPAAMDYFPSSIQVTYGYMPNPAKTPPRTAETTEGTPSYPVEAPALTPGAQAGPPNINTMTRENIRETFQGVVNVDLIYSTRNSLPNASFRDLPHMYLRLKDAYGATTDFESKSWPIISQKYNFANAFVFG